MQVVEAIAYQKLDQRLAALLVNKAPDGEIHATHQALADELGSVQEIVSRLLRSFEDRGWVDLGRSGSGSSTAARWPGSPGADGGAGRAPRPPRRPRGAGVRRPAGRVVRLPPPDRAPLPPSPACSGTCPRTAAIATPGPPRAASCATSTPPPSTTTPTRKEACSRASCCTRARPPHRCSPTSPPITSASPASGATCAGYSRRSAPAPGRTSRRGRWRSCARPTTATSRARSRSCCHWRRRRSTRPRSPRSDGRWRSAAAWA